MLWSIRTEAAFRKNSPGPYSMKVTVRSEYACLAMMELASPGAKKRPLRVLDMAKGQGISPQFLVQVLQQLRASGLVESIRGAAGGFSLARSPSKITMADIVDAVDDAARMPRIAFLEEKATKEMGVITGLWQELHRKQRKVLVETTLAEMVARLVSLDDLVYMI